MGGINSAASERASEPRARSEPSKRRVRARVGESEERSPSVKIALLLLLVIAALALTFLVFGPTLTYGFDYDDYHFVHPYTHGEVAAAFHGPWDASGIERPYYRPLTISFFALRFAILGINSTAHHGLSLLLFAIAATLTGWLVFRLTDSAPFGLLATLFFIGHPGMPYSLVAWVTNQMHLIECIVVLTALVWWDAIHRRSAAWWFPLLGFATVAFLIKEDGIMLLPVIVVLQVVRRWVSDDRVPWPPPWFLAVVVGLIVVLLGVRGWALAEVAAARRPRLDVALSNYFRGLYGLFRLVPADRRWQLAASWFVTLVPLAALVLWRRSTRGARMAMASGLAIAMLFDLPFIFITKAEQLHFVALGASVFLTGACAVVWTGLRIRGQQYAFAVVALMGVAFLALVARDISRDFEPFGPVVLAHDEIVQTWAAVPADLRDYLARKRLPGAERTLSSDPSAALNLAMFGGHAAERSPDGVPYHWMAGAEVEILATGRARAITIPLRHAFEVFHEPTRVRVTVDGRLIDDLVLVTSDWRVSQTGLRESDVSPLRRMHRIAITIDHAWRPIEVIPGSQDGRTLGLQVGQVQIR